MRDFNARTATHGGPRVVARWVRAAAAFLLLAQGLGHSAGAEATAPSPAALPTADGASPWLQGIGPFLDQVLEEQRAIHGVPGAAIAVVHGHEILHLAGHGKADLRSARPVSPQETLFRVGSVAKTLTWTAVMQLVEQGRLDLHGDVNRYLDRFQIPATFPQPVTLAHLLTHTAGFEERGFGTYARSARDLVPLGAFLATQMPARIFRPGEVSAYSNYGAALAGYLVERVSETPFEDSMEAQVLTPLGMSSSSFRQPLPPPMAARLATGYGPSMAPGAFEWDLEGPAGALSGTAADMARFMSAHLGKGRIKGVRILREETAEAMQRRQFANHPAVSGLTYGFQELNLAGQRVLFQPGDMLYFTAALFLLPEQDLGLFVAYNRGRVSEAPTELLQALLARLFPLAPWFAPGPSTSSSEGDLGRFAGTYRSTRRNESTLEKLQELFSPVNVLAVAPGTLRASGLAVVPRALWVETEPGVFRDQASPELIAFREDGAGQVTHVFEGNFPAAGYSRVPWYGVPALHYAVLAVGALLFSLTPIIWSVGALWRPGSGTPLARRARRSAGALCVTNLLFLAGMVRVMARGQELLYGITPFARAVLVLPLISAGLTGLTLVLALLALRRRLWTCAGRLHYLILGLVGMAFLGSLHYWNLLGLRF